MRAASTERRIGIVTIVDEENLGNRLQNFALQECLVARGWSVETIRNSPSPMRRSLLAARAVAAVRSDGVIPFARRNATLARDRVTHRGRPPAGIPSPGPARRDAIAEFTRTHIRELGTEFAELSDPRELASRYDHVVVGSDQVWNPGFRQANEIDFLTFVRPEQRVAYAASFGVPEVPTFLRSRYARWLAGIPHISVREHSGARIVHDLTGRTVPVVADPTLLLDPVEWQERAETHEALLDRRYVATFFLGGRSPEHDAALAEHARSEGLEVVDLLGPAQPELAALSPLQFLGAIRGAEIVATDSFHASLFSLVFERPSITRSRHDDDTRLSSLFHHAGISREPWRVAGLSSTGTPDWPAVRSRLTNHRAESQQFLDVAIGPRVVAEGSP